jgi:hypothetical protein
MGPERHALAIWRDLEIFDPLLPAIERRLHFGPDLKIRNTDLQNFAVVIPGDDKSIISRPVNGSHFIGMLIVADTFS